MNTQLPSHFLSAMSKIPKRHESHSTQEFEIQDFPTAVLPPILADMVKDFLVCHSLFNQPLSHMSLDRLQHLVP